MKLSVTAYVALGASALGITLFQNCSGTKFSDSPQIDSSSTAAAASVTLPGGTAGAAGSIPAPTTGTPLQASSPEMPNTCYDVTCESDAGGFKTISGGMTNAEGVVSVVAPTTGSGWVVAINTAHQVYSSLNCYPDQLMGANAPTPTFYSASLCTDNAGAINGYDVASFPQGPTFSQGKGRYLSACALTPCGYMKSVTFSDGHGFYEWAAAGFSAGQNAAVLKLRVKDYSDPSVALNAGVPYGVDGTVAPGQCAVQSATINTGKVPYQFCLSNAKILKITTPQQTLTLDLSGVKPIN